MNSKVWFVTGASRGLGRIWTEAALKRGDKVTATARNLDAVADLKERYPDAVLPLVLDVTNAEQVHQAVEQAYAHFGRLDVLVNNAGYSLIATAEEATDHQVSELFNANYFGVVRVLRAALPLLRKQGSGHILGVSSSVGLMPAPLIGYYSASKAAVEALHEAMAKEIEPFGIKVTIIEPGAYATEFGKSAARANSIDAYGDLRQQTMARLAGLVRGNPEATADAVLKLVDAEQPPLRLILGTATLPAIRSVYSDRLATWQSWEATSNAAQG
jgi:NAD(P)-dependent dehydrogenase (short-subunit alcohol dehydrogenase family)